MATRHVRSEIPGNVWKVEVVVGEMIEDGTTLVVLESMKMEIPVQSTIAGRVSEIFVQAGDFVGEGDAIVAVSS